ncbi:hypothetical protein M2149_000778 [Lachnospiraceae bacterium PFB1-21]
MAIKIDVQNPTIPIEIGELKFEFEKSDKNVKRFYKCLNQYQADFHKLFAEDESDETPNSEAFNERIEQLDEFLKVAFDDMLGEGAYDKIRALGASTLNMSLYFFNLSMGIKKELSLDPVKEILDKYTK